MLFWCWVAVVKLASLSFYLQNALKFPSCCLGTISECVCGGVPIFWLHISIVNVLCYLVVCVCPVCSWQKMGVSYAPMCPLQQQRVWSLTPPFNTLASPLHSLFGYVWVCGCLCMFVALSQTYCMFKLKLDCLHWALFAYRGSIHSSVQMWHHASLFLCLSMFMIHFVQTELFCDCKASSTDRFNISTENHDI